MDKHESYVSLETAQLLKKAGFDWGVSSYYMMDENAEKYGKICFYTQGGEPGHNDCNSFYGDATISAPTLAIAQKWLMEVKGYEVYALRDNKDSNFYFFAETQESEYGDRKWIECDDYGDTYEESLEDGIKKCLTLIISKR